MIIPIPQEKEIEKVLNKQSTAEGLLCSVTLLNHDISTLCGRLRRRVLSAIFSSDKSYYPLKPLGKVLNYKQPGPYIVNTTDYSEMRNEMFPTPVLTPGKTFILGYTNEKTGIFEPENNVIIFDDFTTSSRLVDFPFKVKSSAMKILESSDHHLYDIQYYFYRLQTIRPILGTHKRFWISIFAPTVVEVPPIDVQQQKASLFRETCNIIDRLQ